MDIERGASSAPARRIVGKIWAALMPLLLLLSACTAASPSPSLERYYQQKPAFVPCKTPLEGTKIAVDGECGQVQVPLNYQKPDGHVARIAVFLRTNPVPAGGNRRLSYIAANDGIVTGLYAERLWPQVVAGLTDLKNGRGDTLLALRDSYHRRSPRAA